MSKIYGWLKKYIDPLVPLWGILPLASCFFVNCLVYWATMYLCAGLKHYDLTLPFDKSVPFVTEWIFVYFVYCYAFWLFGYCYVARTYRNKKKKLFRFVTADMLSRVVCMIFFIVLPTTNVRPEITGTALSDEVTRFLYSVDQPVNLFPSIHCLVSWLCFIGIRNAKNVPLFVKIFELVSAVAIMASTQFLKQHYIVDVIAGVALAEICYMVCKYIKLPKYVRKFFDKVNIKLLKLVGGKA